MTGRYDEKVFSIWNEQSLSAAIQYYIFKKYKQKRFVFDFQELYQVFKRYWKNGTDYNESQLEKMFRYTLEKESANIIEIGNFDCKNVVYFSMKREYKE